MKLISVLVLLFVVAFISSCKSTCLTPFLGVTVWGTNSTPDTEAVITQYQKGSNFATAISSTSQLAISGSPNFWPLQLGENIYSYDWLILFRPSGKSIRLSDITHSDRSEQCSIMGCPEHRCVNSVSYVANGVLDIVYTSSTSSGTANAEIRLTY
jgi:hypothetical protein